MPRTVRHARLESRSARARLKRGRQPHWQALVPGGRWHIGYQHWKGDAAGRWVMRRYIGGDKYRISGLGLADDDAAPDGVMVLSFEQAVTKANTLIDTPASKVHNLTVRQAMDRYVAYKRSLGQPVSDVLSRGAAHILPVLGDLVVSELTTDTLRRWLSNMAALPALSRPKDGKQKYRPAAATEEEVRKRRATANRVLTMLKAGLNFAFDEGHVSNRDAWGRKLKPFRDVERARVRYLTVAQAERLLNACDPKFRGLVRAGLETGCRYGELTRLECADFNPDSATVHIRRSKTGPGRHVVLTPEGAAFFRAHTAGRPDHQRMFLHSNSAEWKKSDQARPMREACKHARITPAVGFHQLRHTYASLSVMNGMPLMVVAKNLGHRDTGMVEKFYGHLAPSFVADAVRASAPRFKVASDKKVVSLK